MQPECAAHPEWGKHRHCPRCRKIVGGTPAVYVEHCWNYCGGRRPHAPH